MKRTRIRVFIGAGKSQLVSSDGVEQISLREAERLDDFFSQVSEHCGLPVVFHEDGSEIGDGDLIVGHYDAIERLLASDRSRPRAGDCIAIGVPRRQALQLAESMHLGGVIDGMSFSQWRIAYPGGQVALYARREFERSMRGSVTAAPVDNSEHYCRITAQSGETLPAFLANYLKLMLHH